MAKARSDRTGNAEKRVVGRPFAKGNSGRPKGIVDNRTLAKSEVLKYLAECGGELKPRVERVRELLLCDDPNVRLNTERWLASYEWGLPKANLTIDGQVNIAALVLAAHGVIVGNGNGHGNGGPK